MSATVEDLYKRLRKAGFDRKFVRARLLPDWWDDSLADVPANRALAEAAISRTLGFPIRDLRNPSVALQLPATSDFRLKRRRGTHLNEIKPALLLARQAANAIVASVVDLPTFKGTRKVEKVREAILEQRQFVNLESLLEYAWDNGIAVLHVVELPKPSKTFSGMVLFCGQTPAIVLASGRDSSPWLAFDLAHELGHVLLGHVAIGTAPLADGDIDQIGNDKQERLADEFACALLTGFARPYTKLIPGWTGRKLATWAQHIGGKRKIDPGAAALVYGRATKRMGVAQNALKALGMDRGAHEKIAQALKRRLPEELPESTARFASLTAAA